MKRQTKRKPHSAMACTALERELVKVEILAETMAFLTALTHFLIVLHHIV